MSAPSAPLPEIPEHSVSNRRFKWVSQVRSFASTKFLRPVRSWFHDRSASWRLRFQFLIARVSPSRRKRQVSIKAGNIVIQNARIPNGVTLATSGQVTLLNCIVGQPIQISGGVITAPFATNPPTEDGPVVDVPKVKREMPLVGYRYWRLTTQGGKGSLLLRAQAQDAAWEMSEPTKAYCLVGGSHQAPHLNCSCGLYAYKTPPAEREGFEGIMTVIGAALLWGRVYEHTDGYRAQYARPIALIRDPWGITDAVAQQVGIPVVEPEHLNAYISEFGDIPPPPTFDRAED